MTAQRRQTTVNHYSDQGCQDTSITFGLRCREVGVRSIAVAWGHQRAARLAAAGADAVVGSPQELAELLMRI